MKKINSSEINTWYDQNHEDRLNDRYINLRRLQPYLAGLDDIFEIEKIGESFEGRDIYKMMFGQGSIKILIWTQMHGNESTGTRAFIDLIKFFSDPGPFSWLSSAILESCTIHCIPMLNPDGAEVYTRKNAQQIDLNRDVIDKKAGESKLLQQMLKAVNPKYCFNMHDQRTIFSVGSDNNPATLSFLAPSINEERSLTEGRKETMQVIASMADLLDQMIPGHLGRYTDEFYPTATGDNFQKMGHNTILIESGHSFADYKRIKTRRATFMALLEGLRFIASKDQSMDHEKYFDIPNNEKQYLDIIIKDVLVDQRRTDIGILFIEELQDEKVQFRPSVDKLESLKDYNADKILDGESLEFKAKGDVMNWVKNKFN